MKDMRPFVFNEPVTSRVEVKQGSHWLEKFLSMPRIAIRLAEDGTCKTEYIAPTLTMEQAKEAIASWEFRDQETLYRWLNVTFRTRMG